MTLYKCVDIDFEYENFLDSSEDCNGKCFGVSLVWAIEALKDIAGDTSSLGFSMPFKNIHKFFLMGEEIQHIYSRLVDERLWNSQIIVNILQSQEDFINSREGRKQNYKINYSNLRNVNLIKINVNNMIKNPWSNDNKAIILSTCLKKPIQHDNTREGDFFGHATALITYNGSCYLFDVNRGIFRVGPEDDYKSIEKNIAESFKLNHLVDNTYGLSTNWSFSMALDIKTPVNKNVETEESIYIG